MLRRSWFTMLALLAIAALALFAACGDDDDDATGDDGGDDGGSDATEVAAVEDVITDLAGYTGEDVDAFLERVTDDFLTNVPGMTREECQADADTCVGEPAEGVTFENTTIAGDTATTEATFTDTEGVDHPATVYLVKEDGQWKVDNLEESAEPAAT